ncbi:hypothetical protein [Clavibacter sp. CFBP 8614]|uniref:hypothetical protein n=1 Tax=unclassified Clavibacter TaxID=2626594 RepID=UPI00404113E9
MNGEWVILSPRPVTVGECVVGAAATDPDLRIASLWDGGAVLLSNLRGGQLTVTGSRPLEHAGDAVRILGVGVEPATHWTEAHARGWGAEDAGALITAIAAAADGHAHRLSTEGHGGSEVELQH